MTNQQMQEPMRQQAQIYKGLEWLVDEIERNLSSAFNELEAFTKEPADETKIHFCLGYLHQISGPFKILQCQGMILLAEEMEALTQSIIDRQVSNVPEACEIVAQVIIRLPAYLRQVLVTRVDQPEALLLLLNDLRAAQGKGLLSEGLFFTPDLSEIESRPASKLQSGSDITAYLELLTRLRQIYQVSLIKLIKDERSDKQYANLEKVFQRLQRLCAGTWRHDLWIIAEQVLGLVARRRIDFSIALKKLFRILDTQLKCCLKDAQADRASAMDANLLKNLLYYLMLVKPETESQQQLWHVYKLAQALPSGAIDLDSSRFIPRYDAGVIRSLVTAIQAELNGVRCALDQFTLDGGLSSEDVRQTLPVLASMSDSLALVGQGRLRDAVGDIDRSLQNIFNSDAAIDDNRINEAVQQLTEVGATLSAWAAYPERFPEEITLGQNQAMYELETAREALLSESRTGIERIKELVVDYINSRWSRDLIRPLPDLFYELSGGLKMMEFERAAAIIDGCGIYVQQHLINQAAQIEWQSLDVFADTISIVEYYLEQICSATHVDQDAILDAAEEGIVGLLEAASPGSTRLDSELEAGEATVESQDKKTISKITSTQEVHQASEEITLQDREIENDILEIFLEEANEVMSVLRSNFAVWENNSEAIESLAIIRRSFHTLKGSGRMVSAKYIGDLSWAVENMLNRLLDGRISINSQIIDLVKSAIAILPTLIEDFPNEINKNTKTLCLKISFNSEELAKGADITKIQEIQGVYEKAEEWTSNNLNKLDKSSNIGQIKQTPRALKKEQKIEALLAQNSPVLDFIKFTYIEYENSRYLLEKKPKYTKYSSKNKEKQSFEKSEKIIRDIFLKEAKVHLRTIDHYLIQARALAPDYQPPTFVLQRALHTLKGAADMAERSNLSMLVSPVDDFVKELVNHQINIDEDIIFLINDMSTFFRDLLNQVCVAEDASEILDEPSGLKLFYQRLNELQEKLVGGLLRSEEGRERSEALLAIKNLMATGLYALQDYPELLLDLKTVDKYRPSICAKIIADLKDVVEVSDIDALTDLSNQLLGIYQDLSGSIMPLSPAAVTLLEQSHESLLSLFDMLAADQDLPMPQDDQHQDLKNLGAQIAAASASQQVEGSTGAGSSTKEDMAKPEQQTVTSHPPSGSPHWMEADLDKEIAGVFVEEAEDIVSHLEEAVQGWANAPENLDFADQLKRDLHTLKGGARMAGFGALGQYSHEFETAVINADTLGKEFFILVETQLERLVAGYEIARSVAQGQSSTEIDNEIAKLLERYPGQITLGHHKTAESAEGSPQTESGPTRPILPSEASSTSISKPLNTMARVREVVRIGSETLDTLVNLSGENIIFRGRVEEQVSEFNHSLDEMDATIVRLQEQIRRLGTETEAQIDHRREQIQASGEETSFDALEMDRYSHLQQLSGSLVESASDLSDLKETLLDKLVGTESLLMHQSRINVDLQEGLMQTRMVPFSRIVPRLRRIVRQVGLELGKDVALAMDNIQGEMDRSVLDRMVAPLEHMIRNAVDHGIENKEQRLSAGKSAKGTISITSYRQGGDILIHIADDGAGLDLARIRELAIEKQLIAESAQLSDYEIAQFIFHPGLTTTESVSEISGRGVGMDVVSSEVKQLGGSVDIKSSAGRGTEFTVVLPFTLAVNRALMIEVAGDHYALSLNSIDGVHFITPQKLRALTSEGMGIEYAGRRYEMLSLASLLDHDISPQADNDHLAESVALVLFHSDSRYFAAQVDEIIGTQEIVVKNLGAQFSVVPGLGGATILSDGRVVVIVDLNELARVAISDGELSDKSDPPTLDDNQIAVMDNSEAESDEFPYILVIDDSVTVRKVTSRILKRHGYRVATAKDGVEALRSLQDKKPQLMLLDIEMPRMDGFEVAMRVRASADLNHIPIIMITSRTGDKHRQRAMELGVNQYMGKPYQEEQLLHAIDQLLVVGSD